MKRNSDPRDHYYVARCSQCPKWIVQCPKSPIKAERAASQHARRCPGHDAYVIDLDTLSVVYRRLYEPLLTVANEADKPPF